MKNTQNIKVNIGKDSLTEKEKEVLRGIINFTCQNCLLNECLVGKLQPHRIIRGNVGGKYSPNNVLMICSKCHKKLHSGEF
jgi:Zn finger protein HypA/HybF involved in hydrogenase expression